MLNYPAETFAYYILKFKITQVEYLSYETNQSDLILFCHNINMSITAQCLERFQKKKILDARIL